MRAVLIVEDDDIVREAMSSGLRMAGYEVVAVSNTLAALREVESNWALGAAIIDVMMPSGYPHGFAFGRMAKLRRPDLRLIFMSGHESVAEADGESSPLLLKPVRVEELVKIISGELVGG